MALEAVLRPFLEHSVRLTSIVAVGRHQLWADDGHHGQGAAPLASSGDAVLLRLDPDRDVGPAIVARAPIAAPRTGRAARPRATLESLARRARKLSNGASGDPLIVLSAPALAAMIGPAGGDFPFRAVVILSSPEDDQPADGTVWRLQRTLFDRGLVGVGSVPFPGGEARCFLASDAVRSLRGLGAGTRGHVTMTCLGSNGRFANQLFQYAYARLYALRHGLTAAVPAWPGQRLFDLDDPPCAGLALPQLRFHAFFDDDRLIWDRDDPPVDVDLWGYFQEIPACWRNHRPLLRHMFRLPVEQRRALDAWRDDVTRGGRRTLVAIHLRRGDYRILQHQGAPWFRIVPADWYLAWLRNLWPTLHDPLLFVATDEPPAVLPLFREFETVSPALSATAPALPRHVTDFEVLRRADYLAICNSSFSRMAAILAPAGQRCFLPSFPTRRFEPYEPWIDGSFWARFADAWRDSPVDSTPPRPARRQPIPAGDDAEAVGVSAPPTIYVDVSDLLLYLRGHTTLTGIQRVQCEILRTLLDGPRPEPIRLVALDDARGVGVVWAPAVRDLIEHLRSHAVSRAELDDRLGALLTPAVALFVRPGDIVLTLGAFWGVSGAGLLFQDLKNCGAIIGVLIHDVISVTDPEYFDVRDTRIFVKGLVEILTFADFVLTTSEYNRASVIRHLAARGLPPRPVHAVPLGHELSIPVPADARISDVVAGIAGTDFVLCVGTIEVRKNPTYLFSIWRLMVRAGRPNVPTLVFVGRKGWLVQDFLEQLRACNYLDGKIVVLHDVTDVELARLYRTCLLTMFPSFAEGWGLPVGESLAHGKICIASRAGAIPEVGGELVDYVDPYDARSGLELLGRYLDDPELRRRREDEIVRRFAPRAWRDVANEFLTSTLALARPVPRFDGVAAITLPPNRFLPISSDPGSIIQDGLDGGLSADLSCLSGWRAPETWGVWADEAATILRFRTDLPVGTRIHLVLRLVAAGRNRRTVRIRSGSGAAIEVSVAGPSERVAVLSCEVEPDNLVSACLSLAGTAAGLPADAGEPAWGLRGILYLQPDRVEGQAPGRSTGNRSSQRPARSSTPPATVVPPDRSERSPSRARIPLGPAPPMHDRQRAASLDAFRQSTDVYWPSGLTTSRHPPIFADDADKQIFSRAQGHHVGTVTDQITLIRRSNQYVSTSRFSEGSVFDRSGVTRAFGYLQGSPPVPWLAREVDGLWISEASLAAAPRYDASYLVFYNGNLHNYYHWMTEGILLLDILAQSLGPDPKLKIALPKSVDIAALLDHRESLRAVGLDGYPIEEIEADLISVREAIWVESDLVQSMPAPHLKAFQQRVAARHAGTRGSRRRRLLVGRKGRTRTIHNLDKVQALLSRYGFETVYLEGMRVVDQITLFQSAEFVIGPHGAGLANLLFCQPGTKVIELMPSVEVRPFFWLISEKLGLVHGLQFCAAVEGQGFQASVVVDVAKLQALYRMVDAYG